MTFLSFLYSKVMDTNIKRASIYQYSRAINMDILKNTCGFGIVLLVILILCLIKDSHFAEYCASRKVEPILITMSPNRAHCFNLCSTRSECKVILFKKTKQFEEDEANMNIYEGNCVLLPQEENNLLSERAEYGKNGFEICRTYLVNTDNRKEWSEPPYTCLSQVSYNVTAAAHEAGFNFEVTEPELHVTRFYKHLPGDVDFQLMEDKCAAHGGLLPQAYDKKSLEALVEIGRVELPVRLGMKVEATNDRRMTSVWMVPYVKDMAANETGSCDKYATWSGSDWANDQSSYVDALDGKIKPGSFNGPVNQITCQFMGPNVAQGRPVKAYYNNDNYGTRSLMTDGDWNEVNEQPKVFHGITRTQNSDKFTWVAVDLGEKHLVNAILFKTNATHYTDSDPTGDYSGKTVMNCYVGNVIPNANTEMTSEYVTVNVK